MINTIIASSPTTSTVEMKYVRQDDRIAPVTLNSNYRKWFERDDLTSVKLMLIEIKNGENYDIKNLNVPFQSRMLSSFLPKF